MMALWIAANRRANSFTKVYLRFAIIGDIIGSVAIAVLNVAIYLIRDGFVNPEKLTKQFNIV